MKFALYMLFFANLVLFGWLYSNPERFAPQLESSVAPFPANVEPLQLLSERGSAIAESEVKPAPNVPPSVSAVQTEQEENRRLSTQESMPAAPDAVPDVVVEVESSAQAEPREQQPVSVPICQAIGPFQQRGDVDRLSAELIALQVTLDVRTAQMEYPADYWVYLPEMAASEARAIMKDLASKGVKDTFLGRQNFISLGVFSDKRTADARARDIRQQGYEPKVEARFRTRDVFWIDIEEQPPTVLSETDWSQRLSAWPDVRRQTVSCE